MQKFLNILKWTFVSLVIIFTFLYIFNRPALQKLEPYLAKITPFAEKIYTQVPKVSKNILNEAKISAPVAESEFAQTANYPSIECKSAENTPFTKEMFRLTNQERNRDKKTALAWSFKLCESAKLKAQDMINNNYFDHVSPTGVQPWYWVKQVGYNYTFVGENLALNYYTAQSANEALMNSQGHRENILNENFTQMGIAYLRGKIDGQDAFVVVQHFGTPTPEQATFKYICEKEKAEDKIAEFKKTKKKIEKYIEEAEDVKDDLKEANQSTKEVNEYIDDMEDKLKEVKGYIKELEDYLAKCE